MVWYWVDDTIVPISTDIVHPEVLGWIEEIRAIVPLWLVTNNPKEYRLAKSPRVYLCPIFWVRGNLHAANCAKP